METEPSQSLADYYGVLATTTSEGIEEPMAKTRPSTYATERVSRGTLTADAGSGDAARAKTLTAKAAQAAKVTISGGAKK